MRLGAQAAGEADTPRAGVAAVVDEAAALVRAGIIPPPRGHARALAALTREFANGER